MITVTTGQLEAWLAQVLWPFLRIGACLMVAPIYGARFVPGRIRIVLAAALTVLVVPLLPPPPSIAPLSPGGVLVTVQQVLIGAASGFVLQVAFDALAMGGQLLANGMGLGFAFNVDPLRGTGTPVVGQLYMIMVTLTFLALDGHILLVQTLVNGFHTLPISDRGPPDATWWVVANWGSQLFAGALSVALPGMTAMLVANLAFGVMSRAAPTLNLFAVGFPLTLAFGLLIVLWGLPAVQSNFIDLIGQSFATLASLGTGR